VKSESSVRPGQGVTVTVEHHRKPSPSSDANRILETGSSSSAVVRAAYESDEYIVTANESTAHLAGLQPISSRSCSPFSSFAPVLKKRTTSTVV
jgi:hypothetical protein